MTLGIDLRDARRFRAMTMGYKAREKGLPADAIPPGTAAGLAEWWLAGWRWKDDQIARARLEAERAALLAKGGPPWSTAP